MWARVLRDVTAICVVAAFMFPLFWLGLTSIKPVSAIFDISGVNWFAFKPTASHYALTLSSGGPDALNARWAFLDSLSVACGAVAVSLAAGLPAAYGLSRLAGRRSGALARAMFYLRAVPPIALAVQAAYVLGAWGLHDTRAGLAFLHGLMNLPIAILVLKSFMDDLPRDAEDAARIDGASRFQVFRHIVVPPLRGAIAATAILCFTFSWTEFLLAGTVGISFKTLPLKLAVLPGDSWGPVAALAMAALAPAFVFILATRRYLARGLTLGLQK